MPSTTITVVRDDGTTKEMSQRQLRANLEPGDQVKGPHYGTGDLVKICVDAVGQYKVTGEVVAGPERYSKIPWDAIVLAELAHPEREA